MDKNKALDTFNRLLEKVKASDSVEEKRNASYAAMQLIIKHELVVVTHVPAAAAGLKLLEDMEASFSQVLAHAAKQREDALRGYAEAKKKRRKRPLEAPPEFPEPQILVVQRPIDCAWCGQRLTTKESCYQYPSGKVVHIACRPYFERK